jgi:hypothetical protein
MTPNDFRRIALSMPEAVEASHMGHADFRVGGKIFATIGWPDERWAMVKLKPEQQAKLVAEVPEVFVPVSGGWGRRGSTNLLLAAADKATVKGALATAWENIAAAVPAKRGGRARAADNAKPPAQHARKVAAAKKPRTPRSR